MQCVISVVVGKAINHGLVTFNVSQEEKVCQKWLNSVLVQNGIEEREKIRGLHHILHYSLFTLLQGILFYNNNLLYN